MKLFLISVGRDRNDPIQGPIETYAGRIRRWAPLDLVELKEEPLRRNLSPSVAMRKEAERIGPKLRGRTIALDRHGWSGTSLEWAQRLERWRDAGTTVSWVIGGPSGLDPSLLEQMDECWSLGPLTLPHRIARLVVAEQLYRAFTILRDEPYHK
ncbi:MAG TPA: 23S rRNA (pseudouridine(1915)-N(3))-methyltransferase RlmH [Myxococcales bacterium LLY-WYZ-16_1]|jgi:23S rRNA (pseudouridine1915-N3)-methyltransferase|nr:23S rRNA (pseudouridine(1915)-N(3))-methyltransferase RlmH [Myxococcales bacterium LLY-WYZ-16_1]